jgi:hypothetical protein
MLFPTLHIVNMCLPLPLHCLGLGWVGFRYALIVSWVQAQLLHSSVNSLYSLKSKFTVSRLAIIIVIYKRSAQFYCKYFELCTLSKFWFMLCYTIHAMLQYVTSMHTIFFFFNPETPCMLRWPFEKSSHRTLIGVQERLTHVYSHAYSD